jgi:UDP-N-acetylglucosamine--N-acetylmuramyl-(pentapeptide) pyrophosphoryl-undecaprenol N-acetylglucosamine transferase
MIALTGGGTGGHLAIAASVKEALNARGHRPLFIGSTAGQDRRWFKSDTGFYDRIFLPSHGVMNRRGVHRLKALFSMLKLAYTCRKALKRSGVTAVLSVGGYSAAPAALAALSLRLPLYIHEQNAVTGSLNRLLRPFARAFFCSFEPQSPCSDYPVKAAFFSTARVRSQIKTVIFLGGSQGASAINRFATLVAPELARRSIRIIHQCGFNDLDGIEAAYQGMGINATCFAFDPHLHERIAKADLAVARAGAGTLFELAANGLPALFVPYPYAAGLHQHQNARFLADRDLGWWVDQSELCAKVLLEKLSTDLTKRSRSLMALQKPEGAACIASQLLKHEPQCAEHASNRQHPHQ